MDFPNSDGEPERKPSSYIAYLVVAIIGGVIGATLVFLLSTIPGIKDFVTAESQTALPQS